MPYLSFKEECERRKSEEFQAAQERDRDNRMDRSRERDISRDRDLSRERYGRDRSREREDSREREHFAQSRGPMSGRTTGHTNSNDPKMLMSRVFIGNLPHEKVSREELTDMFSKYGRVLAVNILKGFGFVQFEYEEEARKAVSMENGGTLKGQRLDVKMAAEGKKQGGGGGRGGGGGGGGGASGRGGSTPFERNRETPRPGGYRERSPIRDRMPPPAYDRTPGRDPYDDPYRRDPYEVYRRDPYPDPYLAAARDPYAVRDPYAARDPYPARPAAPAPAPVAAIPERPPVDCEITVLERGLREYADSIDRRLRMAAMLTFVNMLPTEELLTKAQEDIAKRKIPFNIVVSAVNQQHRSITVRILHGTPQEHRNMPLEDALKLVTTSFDAYMRTMRAKTAPTPAAVAPSAPVAGAGDEMINPDGGTSYLLHLLADNRFLTVEELNKVLVYLTDRRDRLITKQGGAPPAKEPAKDEATLAQQQQDLQAKILSVLGGTGNESTVQAGTTALQQLASYGNAANVDLSTAASLLTGGLQQQHNAASLLGGVAAASQAATNGGYNLNTPGVQQALDNLMSSSSSLLQNLGTGAGGVQAVAGQDAVATSQASQGTLFQGYGAYPGY